MAAFAEQSTEDQRNHLTDLLLAQEFARLNYQGHSPQASDFAGTQMALSQLSDPDTAISDQSFGPIGGLSVAPSGGGRTTDLDKQADADLEGIGYGTPSFTNDFIAAGNVLGATPSFEGMGYGMPGAPSMNDYSPGGFVSPGGNAPMSSSFASLTPDNAVGWDNGFANNTDMLSPTSTDISDMLGPGYSPSGAPVDFGPSPAPAAPGQTPDPAIDGPAPSTPGGWGDFAAGFNSGFDMASGAVGFGGGDTTGGGAGQGGAEGTGGSSSSSSESGSSGVG